MRSIMNATSSRMFNRNNVFCSSPKGTNLKRIRIHQIPAPNTINVLFIHFSPLYLQPSEQIVMISNGYNTCLYNLKISLEVLQKSINAFFYNCFYMPYYRIQEYTKRLRIGKIICLARTYKKHAQEMNSKVTEEPLLFLKPASSVIFNHETIIIPSISKCLHHEVELGIIIGKNGKKISEEKAMLNVLGYLVGLDITARDIQTIAKKNGWPWTIAKGFDTFAPLSDVVLKEKVLNPQNLEITLRINGVIKQKANTNQLIYTIAQIISYISKIMTLERGDLILTGTPEGVGEIKDGDILEAELDSLCSLIVNVKQNE